MLPPPPPSSSSLSSSSMLSPSLSARPSGGHRLSGGHACSTSTDCDNVWCCCWCSRELKTQIEKRKRFALPAARQDGWRPPPPPWETSHRNGSCCWIGSWRFICGDVFFSTSVFALCCWTAASTTHFSMRGGASYGRRAIVTGHDAFCWYQHSSTDSAVCNWAAVRDWSGLVRVMIWIGKI